MSRTGIATIVILLGGSCWMFRHCRDAQAAPAGPAWRTDGPDVDVDALRAELARQCTARGDYEMARYHLSLLRDARRAPVATPPVSSPGEPRAPAAPGPDSSGAGRGITARR